MTLDHKYLNQNIPREIIRFFVSLKLPNRLGSVESRFGSVNHYHQLLGEGINLEHVMAVGLIRSISAQNLCRST
jgi:hypothetical protein